MNSPEDPMAPSGEGFHTPIGGRRRFFQWITAIIAGTIGLGLSVPLVGYVVCPALKRRTHLWVDIGGVDELDTCQPKQLLHATTVQDGYMETKAIKSVWAVKEPNGEIKVFSPICPHLGCGYHWDNDKGKFACPCHGSVYSITGQVLAGPAPRPLDDLPEKIENGRLLVIYKEFKSGLPKKVEI